ncbi:MAG: protein kinase [Gammaproteobacteria bacterium]|nr:protein kinase [Gammaproteobacteria bacterium]
MATTSRIYEFNLGPGRVLSGRYEVVSFLGGGWEGEVYRVRERATGIERTAKLFFPQRNVRDRAVKFYAKKLHKLKNCPIVIPYHFQDTIRLRGTSVSFLVSDYVEGEVLSKFLSRQPGGRLGAFTALHLLHALASGMECIHKAGEYHGDLHPENIIVQRYGLGFELKVLDLYYWDAPKRESIRDDVVEMVRIFHESLGGARHYPKQPKEVKAICLGLKKSLILQKFRTATQLKHYLETMAWS